MRCYRCKAENRAGITECENCGTKLSGPKTGPMVDEWEKKDRNANSAQCQWQGCCFPATTFPGVVLGGGSGWCRFHLHCDDARWGNEVMELSKRWEIDMEVQREVAPYLITPSGRKVENYGYGQTLDTVEAREMEARRVAISFGADPRFPPRERCLAVMAIARRKGQVVGGGYERTPGEDDE